MWNPFRFASNSSPLSWCLVFFPALLFSAQFSSVLCPFLVFFLHSISVTGTTSLFVNHSLADCANPLILQALIANLSIFLYLFTESMGSCLQLGFLFWALLYVSRLFLTFRVNEKMLVCRSLRYFKVWLWVLSWTGKLIIRSVKILVQCFLGPHGWFCAKESRLFKRNVQFRYIQWEFV